MAAKFAMTNGDKIWNLYRFQRHDETYSQGLVGSGWQHLLCVSYTRPKADNDPQWKTACEKNVTIIIHCLGTIHIHPIQTNNRAEQTKQLQPLFKQAHKTTFYFIYESDITGALRQTQLASYSNTVTRNPLTPAFPPQFNVEHFYLPLFG